MAMSGWLLHSDPATPASEEMPESMHKITVQYVDPADGEDFETAYRERHVPLVQAVPGLERFTISLAHLMARHTWSRSCGSPTATP